MIDVDALFFRISERWKLFVCFAVIGMLTAGVYCFHIAKPQYQAVSKMYLRNRSDSAINLSEIRIASAIAGDYRELMRTWEVVEEVSANLSLDRPVWQLSGMVSLDNPINTRVLYVTVTSTDPAEARDIANEYANVTSERIAQVMRVEKPIIISTALLPEEPISFNKGAGIVAGAVCGLLLATAIVLLQYLSDDKVRAADDLQLAELDSLAVVPLNRLTEKDDRSRMT